MKEEPKVVRARHAAAIRRVVRDGAVSLGLVADRAGVTEQAALRWAKKGRAGVRLDAVVRAGKWFSSFAALDRFRELLAARGVEVYPPGGPEAAARPAAGPHTCTCHAGRPGVTEAAAVAGGS